MRASPTMERIITRIAEKHGLDLTTPGQHLKLAMPNMDNLVIETLAGKMISVAHYYEQEGDLMRDPEVVFYVPRRDTGWYAVEVTMDPIGKWARYAEQDEAGVWHIDHKAQVDLAAFVRTWARNIREQRWFENGERVGGDDDS